MDFEKYILPEPKRILPIKPLLKGQTPSDYRNYADMLEAYDIEMIQHKKQLAAWREKKEAMDKAFKEDLFKELGISNHPKREKIFEMAYDEHHYDLEGLYDYAKELADLMRSN